VKKLLAVFMTMVMAGFLSLGAVGCKKEETKKTETKVEKKDAGGTETKTETKTEKTTDKKNP
jgi:hypothetical protein